MTKLKFFNVTTTYIDQLEIGNGIYNLLEIGNKSIRRSFCDTRLQLVRTHSIISGPLLSSVYFF